MRAVALALLLTGCGFNFKFYFPPPPGEIAWGDPEQGFIDGRLHYAFAQPVSEPRATVLILHGNAGDLATAGPVVQPFVDAGFATLVFDYPGYGKSKGRATHRSVLRAAHDALTFVGARKKGPLLVAGFSLGGQIGITLAADRGDEIDALLVEGTFTSHRDIAAASSSTRSRVFARAFVRGPYDAAEEIRRVTIPKLIVHSRDDPAVPHAMGVALYNRAPHPKMMWSTDGPHLKTFDRHPDEYAQRVDELLAVLGEPGVEALAGGGADLVLDRR